MKVIKKKNEFLFFFLIGIIFSLILVTCSILLLSRIFQVIKNKEETDSFISQIRILEMNPKTGEIKHKFISSSKYPQQQIKKDEYISYKNNKGQYFLISNPESQEYQCYGTCICIKEEEDDDDISQQIRSSSSSTYLASKTLFYLIASTTSLIAYKKAKEYFHKECEENSSNNNNYCPSSTTVHSKIDYCEGIDIDSPAEKRYINKSKKKIKLKDGERIYSCEGDCSISNKLKTKDLIKQAKEYHCEHISSKDEIIINNCNIEDDEKECLKLAQLKFNKIKLNPFCSWMSREESYFDMSTDDGDVATKIKEMESNKIPIELCQGKSKDVKCYLKQIAGKKKKNKKMKKTK